jgi:hypothetical protein
MITLDDIDKIMVSASCQESWPCAHRCTITLKDGRSFSYHASFETCSIISNIANKKINPGKKWGADAVREHFSRYSTYTPDIDCEEKSPEELINIFFTRK